MKCFIAATPSPRPKNGNFGKDLRLDSHHFEPATQRRQNPLVPYTDCASVLGVNTGFLYVTKEVEFSSAHRLYREDLSEEKNLELFGKCAYPYGHGHNYRLQVTVKGRQVDSTDMVVHFSRLKALLEELVVVPMDHRHLNHDVSFLKGVLPTSENVVLVLWDRLQAPLASQNLTLYKLRLASSERNWVEYFGEATNGV